MVWIVGKRFHCCAHAAQVGSSGGRGPWAGAGGREEARQWRGSGGSVWGQLWFGGDTAGEQPNGWRGSSDKGWAAVCRPVACPRRSWRMRTLRTLKRVEASPRTSRRQPQASLFSVSTAGDRQTARVCCRGWTGSRGAAHACWSLAGRGKGTSSESHALDIEPTEDRRLPLNQEVASPLPSTLPSPSPALVLLHFFACVFSSVAASSRRCRVYGILGGRSHR